MGLLENLELYKAAKVYRDEIIGIANTFPKEEKFNLTSQIKRSARSITANIAEGYGRYHYQETMQFCRHSRGSLFETNDHLTSALTDNYIKLEKLKEQELKGEKLLRLLNGYILYLKKQKESISG